MFYWPASRTSWTSGGYSRLRSSERYPAPGSRDGGTGTLYYIGQGGYSWSSLSVPAGGSDAYYLGFGYSGIYPQNGNYRASGLQVRCLLE